MGSWGLADAIGEYEREVRERAGTEVQISLKSMQMAHNWEMLVQQPMFKTGAQKNQGAFDRRKAEEAKG